AAFTPILFTIVLMVFFNKPAKIVLPLAWFLLCLIAYFIWQLDLLRLTAYTIFGALKAFDILVIIFGAVLILNTLKLAGAMQVIQDGFTGISPDPRIQACIIGFLFSAFI